MGRYTITDKDFPRRIYIAKFEKVEIPEIVKGSFSLEIFVEEKGRHLTNKVLPKEIQELFRASGKETVSHDGIVYKKEGSGDGGTHYNSYPDVTGLVQKAVSRPEVQEPLSVLENSIGKEILISLAMPDFGRDFIVVSYRDFSLCFYNIQKKEEGNFARLGLTGAWSTAGGLSLPGIGAELGMLWYEGREELKLVAGSSSE